MMRTRMENAAPPNRTIVVIGSSTGGPRTLETIFSRFPLVDAAIIIVQHMPLYINSSLCRHLAKTTQMEVGIAEDGDPVEHGTIYVAPSDVHLKLVGNRTIRLFNDEKVQFVRPSIDVAMTSLEKSSGDRFAGVILSGMGSDGAQGIRHPRHAPSRVRDRKGGPDAPAGRNPGADHPDRTHRLRRSGHRSRAF